MKITAKQLATIYQKNESLYADWIDVINDALEVGQINTPLRVSAFLAQVGHESLRLTVFTENLNYSANALMGVFKKYFTQAQATQYARKPEAIANRVYANRMGNGDEASGDGWKYRGRGSIQVTGLNNYKAFMKWLDQDVVSNPDLLATDKKVAIEAGVWYWIENGLNTLADAQQFDTITRRINGGLNGKEDRDMLYKRAKEVLGV